MAETVWDVKGETTEETAAQGIGALESFIREIGLPTRWSEMGITDESLLRAAAYTCFLMPGCCKPFTRDEIFEVLKECMYTNYTPFVVLPMHKVCRCENTCHKGSPQQ